jgi:hypothetical protein
MPDHSAGRYSEALSLMYDVALLVGPPLLLLLESVDTTVAVALLLATPLVSLPAVLRRPGRALAAQHA